MWVSSSVWVSPIHSKLKFCNVFENALWALDKSKQISLFMVIIYDENILIIILKYNMIYEIIYKKNKIKIYYKL